MFLVIALMLTTPSEARIMALSEGVYYDTETEEVFCTDQRGGMKSYESGRHLRPDGYNKYRDMETKQEIEVLPGDDFDENYPGFSLDKSYHDDVENYDYDNYYQ